MDGWMGGRVDSRWIKRKDGWIDGRREGGWEDCELRASR